MASEFNEIRDQMEIKDRKISVLQRKIENLEDLLKEKDNQVDMARARLQQYTTMSHGERFEAGTLSSLEDAIIDKDKQMGQLREQRDRAEQERIEERELHERDLAEAKLKVHALESEVEKLQVKLERALAEKVNTQLSNIHISKRPSTKVYYTPYEIHSIDLSSIPFAYQLSYFDTKLGTNVRGR